MSDGTGAPRRRRLESHGLSVAVPAGWDVRIGQRAEAAVPAPASKYPMSGFVHPTLHAASSPLPAVRGDYGSGYVETMTVRDAFVCLVEFDHEAGDTEMFDVGQPTRLRAGEFHPEAQQRVIAGMCGTQRFFTAEGRAFCLYVVLGSWLHRKELTAEVNAFISSLQITPRTEYVAQPGLAHGPTPPLQEDPP